MLSIGLKVAIEKTVKKSEKGVVFVVSQVWMTLLHVKGQESKEDMRMNYMASIATL